MKKRLLFFGVTIFFFGYSGYVQTAPPIVKLPKYKYTKADLDKKNLEIKTLQQQLEAIKEENSTVAGLLKRKKEIKKTIEAYEEMIQKKTLATVRNAQERYKQAQEQLHTIKQNLSKADPNRSTLLFKLHRAKDELKTMKSH